MTEVNPLGPLQEYVVPELVAVKFNVCPVQRGELLPATGTVGGAFTTAVVVPIGPVQPFSVAVTEYVPVFAVPAAAITGF